MQVLLCNQQLEEVLNHFYLACTAYINLQPENFAMLQVDLSNCFQVGVHNVEFFLQNVVARPSPKLKQLTVCYRKHSYVRSCCCCGILPVVDLSRP